MPERIFRGYIHPIAVARGLSFTFLSDYLPIHGAPRVTCDGEVLGGRFKLKVRGEASDGLIDTLKNYIPHLLSAHLNVRGWDIGVAYTVEVTHFIQDGVTHRLSPGIPCLAATPPRPPGNLDGFSRIAIQALSRPRMGQVTQAFAALRRAILNPDDTVFECYRAMEALAQFFHDDYERGKPVMCERLNLDLGWLREQFEENPAAAVRHGTARPVSDPDRKNAFLASRILMERFLAAVVTGAALSLAEYPLLTRTSPSRDRRNLRNNATHATESQ